MTKTLIIIILVLLVLILGGVLFYKPSLNPFPEDELKTVHSTVVNKIESMGKLELVRYEFKDVVEHSIVRQWFPDPKILLIVEGEAVGCIDLEKVDSSSVYVLVDTVYINLPAPELCYSKVNHEKSRVFNTEYTFFDSEAQMVDAAYREAEKEIQRSALSSPILANTQIQAEKILKPMLETIAGRPVKLIFPGPKLKPAQ